jgi:NADH-quinone oxidoreductase B subunit
MLDTLRKGLLKKGVVTIDYPGDPEEERLLMESNPDIEALGKKLNAKIKKAFGRSLAIREVDAGSCNGCEVEVNALTNAIYDIERFGLHIVASPRHADLLLVTGPVTRNMEHALRQTYDATPAPKLVVAMGTCAIDGGIFRGSYAVLNGVGNVLPVDVYIPGCPPRPQAIIQGIMLALDKMGKK